MNGVEMLMKSLVKALGLDPNKIFGHLEEMRQHLANGAGDMAAIRRDQLRIMQHLGIEPETEGTDNDGRNRQAAIQ